MSGTSCTERKRRVAEIRSRARRLFDGGATGIQVAAAISESTDELLVELFEETLLHLSGPQRSLVEEHSAVLAVGGTGRGELAPYSDVDLLFLFRAAARERFGLCASQVVRDCWDAGIKLGHSIRTIGETVGMARQKPEVATSLVDARLLWGSEQLFDRFRRTSLRRVVHGRLRAFVEECVTARQAERDQYGSTVSRLEPDVKRSAGGLRDLHLIGWVGFAHYGTPDVDSLRLQGALSKDDARMLLAAREFLTRIRIDLHFAAGRANDVLSRDEQLRIARERGVEATAGQRSVERFMQTYFHHSTAIADIARCFVALQQPRSLSSRLVGCLMTHRAEGVFKVGQDRIDVVSRYRDFVCGSLEQILRLYRSAVLYGVRLAPELIERIKQFCAGRNGNVGLSEIETQLFLKILGSSGHLGPALRSMYETGVLELLVPAMVHARCLLQFNLYHSYTVDEHSLQAVEAAEQFEQDDGPVGTAYRAVQHKQILHLALLLHDLGKGFEQDHNHVGRQIAEETAARLGLPDHDRETLVFLVHRHLRMSHLALRRDVSDPEMLVAFSREVGSPDTLRMLYVLTAADLTAVGPGVWTSWKAELLAELYDGAMRIVSGEPYRYQQQERLRAIKGQVRSAIVPLVPDGIDSELAEWLDRQTDAFPPHYLTATPPERIIADLKAIGRLGEGEVVLEGRNEIETGTVEFRIIAASDLAEGCFHKVAGVLTAKRLGILSAQICTTLEGIVVDSFRVLDDDYAGPSPPERIDEIAESIRASLTSGTLVEQLFQRHLPFGSGRANKPISELSTRVVIDNTSSESGTIIDVFAHDRPGLLYIISRTIYEMDLSVMLAKISTHFDQIVDVFYVTDAGGRKIDDTGRLKRIRSGLEAAIELFEREGHLLFVP